MFCADCEADLEEIPVGESCPSCGGQRRNTVVHAAAALACVATLTATTSIGYNPRRPWPQKWRDVVHGLNELRQSYAQNDLNNEVVRRQVEEFFKGCRELADWLRASAGRGEAMDFVHTNPALKLCDAMAQTTKHHTRHAKPNGDPITAWIARIHGAGVKAEIEWSAQSGASGVEDALDLAEQCVAAWESFLRVHQLDPTS